MDPSPPPFCIDRHIKSMRRSALLAVFIALQILCLRCLVSFDYAAAAAIVASSSSSPSLTLRSSEVRFPSLLKGLGVSGFMVLDSPEADACSPLESVSGEWGSSSAILLAMKGDCPAYTKARHAQDAGFAAIIMYNNDSDQNIAARRSYGMTIPAVFVTKSAGEALAKFSVNEAASVQILPDYEDTIWSVMVFMLILLLAIAAGLVTWCFVKRNRNRRRSRFKGPCVISSRIVEAMPTEVYRIIGNEKAAQESCTICLEEYIPGEILRVLPCSHRFHATCVDAWLTLWRAVCPMCKRDARYEFPDLQASEQTPLLGFAPIWASSSESPPIQIPPSHSNFLNNYLDASSFSKGDASSSKHYPPPFSGSSLNEFRRFTSLQSSLEAFRASPYFTPPSLSHKPSPLLPGYAYSPAVGSVSRYSYGSSRDHGGKSFLNPERASCASPLAGSYSSASDGSDSTYLNPGKGCELHHEYKRSLRPHSRKS